MHSCVILRFYFLKISTTKKKKSKNNFNQISKNKIVTFLFQYFQLCGFKRVRDVHLIRQGKRKEFKTLDWVGLGW